MRKEESFPVPLKYIDVIRSTHTDLDVSQEKRIDEYWNVNEKQKFVRFVDRFYRIYVSKRDISKRMYVVPGGETDKNSNDITSRSHVA